MQIFFCLTMINFTCGGKWGKRANVCFAYTPYCCSHGSPRVLRKKTGKRSGKEKKSTTKRKKKKQIANNEAESARLRVASIEIR
jgi:predicted metal-binding transcription factor (methanogenesis marker protein 9)